MNTKCGMVNTAETPGKCGVLPAHFESERSPAGQDPLRGNRSRQAEQFSQESDEEIHGWDDTTGRVVSKVIAFRLPGG